MIAKSSQGNIMNGLRKWYKEHINISFINMLVKECLRLNVSILAWLKRMKFPKKYDWDWKLEMLLGKYEREATTLVRKLVKPEMTVLDIGAHIGYYSRVFSKLVGKNGLVYAFEPDDDNFKILRENTKKFKNIKIYQKAISDKDGFINFYKASGSTGCHSILTSKFRKNKITIPSETIDSFVKREEIKNVDLIKIDIEGGEPFAFHGAKNLLNQPSLMIIMEFTPSNFALSGISPIDFLQNFIKLGFKIYEIKNKGILKIVNSERPNIKELILLCRKIKKE